MATVEELGVTVKRQFNTSSVEVSGIEVRSKETTELSLTLPVATEVAASFCKEGLGRKVVKLFKKELQTGDSSFDDAVYISTDTPEATAKLLQNNDVRWAIGELVSDGGTIEIGGTRVVAEVAGHCEDMDPHVAQIVQALLGG